MSPSMMIAPARHVFVGAGVSAAGTHITPVPCESAVNRQTARQQPTRVHGRRRRSSQFDPPARGSLPVHHRPSNIAVSTNGGLNAQAIASSASREQISPETEPSPSDPDNLVGTACLFIGDIGLTVGSSTRPACRRGGALPARRSPRIVERRCEIVRSMARGIAGRPQPPAPPRRPCNGYEADSVVADGTWSETSLTEGEIFFSRRTIVVLGDISWYD